MLSCCCALGQAFTPNDVALVASANAGGGVPPIEPSDGYNTNLIAYYPCEDASNTSTIEDTEASSDPTKTGSLNATSVSGKINNALDLSDGDYVSMFTGLNNDWRGHSFACRFWMK